jgi:hypothetical protein
VVGEPAQQRRGSHTEASAAAQPLGRCDGLTPAVILRMEGKEVGRLGDHRAGSFCSMNLAGSKLIERYPRLSNKICRKALSCW